jgi:hypothetical protein
MTATRTIPALVLLALAAATASAQTGQDRMQVRQELVDARRHGELLVPGETGLTERELHPSRYPGRTALAGKTREQVRAELAQAQRDGDLIAYGESGLSRYEQQPAYYPARTTVAARSRAEVKAEVIEARRHGELMAAGELGAAPQGGEAQRRAATAGRRAPDMATVALPSLPAASTARR